MAITRFYVVDESNNAHIQKTLKTLRNVSKNTLEVQIEKCYHVESGKPLDPSSREESILRWLLKGSQYEYNLTKTSQLPKPNETTSTILEIGPRFSFSTPFSTNCVNICQNVGLNDIIRLECSIRYYIAFSDALQNIEVIVDVLGDKMTECLYTDSNMPKESFNENLPKLQESWYFIPIVEEGRSALEKLNQKLGLAFSDWDLDYYTNLFQNILQRNPTTVEIFDCAQSNSEHSRHWFFRGELNIDGKPISRSLIKMVMDTQNYSNPNNTIKFRDNSSAIKGFTHKIIKQTKFNGPNEVFIDNVDSDLIFTAETHNMPTAVCPFSGATTGTGGRLRDIQGVGRGGIPIAGTAGYSVGCLNIPGWKQPYENNSFQYPPSFANPLKILIEASNGASDYGNKFGEPVITGFVTSYGLSNAEHQRYEYVKPIMFSGGLGIMRSNMRNKINPSRGMFLAKIGGPVYRIGIGGGAASSVEVQGSNSMAIDFNAVQRGDAEMENKLNRVIRACIEMEDRNPILAIHDQGAGGNGNVLKELVEPGLAGAVIFSKEFQLGDPTITALELWGAEYQENNAILCKPEDRQLLESICERERCPICFVGIVTGDGFVTLLEEPANFEKALQLSENRSELNNVPFDLQLKHVLGEMPRKKFDLTRQIPKLTPLRFLSSFDLAASLEKVLGVVSVGSKRYLTNKVDRCVTGLIAQQQCVGPLHTPLADYGLVKVSHFSSEGIATSIGSQPIKGLLDMGAMARMSVAEALSNLAFVKISELSDVKCSANWMWAAKLPGEGAKMFDACHEMCAIMKELNIAIDGGKDSLSMAAKCGNEIVKSPGTLVISTYAPCPDVSVKVTPDLKGPSAKKETSLLWINIENKFRLGGSVLAHVYGEQGNECPNLLCTEVLKNAFNITQSLLAKGKVLAGHDISEGGLIVSLLEMSFAGLSGLTIDLTRIIQSVGDDRIDAASRNQSEVAILFAEECGWIIEVETSLLEEISSAFINAKVPNHLLGTTSGYGLTSDISIILDSRVIFNDTVKNLYKQWERISFEIEKLQCNYECAIEEYGTLDYREGPKYSCDVDLSKELVLQRATEVVRVAVVREEGINSDKEVMACLLKANFEVHDVTMSDLVTGKTVLSNYQGIVFPGGFSYADTLGSAKGWAANIIFHENLASQFKTFKERNDTFSIGICNGCQLLSLIGWVGNVELEEDIHIECPNIVLLQNNSERFECRWVTLKILKSNAIFFKNMENWVLGCWIAHGEGRFSFRNENILNTMKSNNCLALQYVDDNGEPTEIYPMNPNGSKDGVAAFTSLDGRHLAIMPHPERCGSMDLWPYIPPNFDWNSADSPWQLIFNNAYKWCTA